MKKEVKELLEYTVANYKKLPYYSDIFAQNVEGTTIKYRSHLKIKEDYFYSNLDVSTPESYYELINNEFVKLITEQLGQEAVMRMFKINKENSKFLDNIEDLNKYPHPTIVVSTEIMALKIVENKNFNFGPVEHSYLYFMGQEGEIFGKKVRVNPYLQVETAVLMYDKTASFNIELAKDKEDDYVIDVYLTTQNNMLHFKFDGVKCLCGKPYGTCEK